MLTPEPFVFIRHGATDWNVANRLQGVSDIPLNGTGLAQARAAAHALKPGQVEVLVTSPLLRAYKTACIIAERHRLPLHVDDRLKERSFGSWEGRLRADVATELGIGLHDDITPHLPPDAEEPEATLARMVSAVNDHLLVHNGKRVGFVGHGAAFRILATALTGTPLSAKTGIPYTIKPAPQSWTITEATPA